MSTVKGRCDCGEIEFECTEAPINSVFCYCTDCQQRTNSDKWFGLWIRENGFSVTKGTPSTFSRKGSSGMSMIHHFCKDCGNNFAVYSEAGQFFTVSVTTLDDSDHYAPEMAIYTASAPTWAVFPEGVPRFDNIPKSMGGTG